MYRSGSWLPPVQNPKISTPGRRTPCEHRCLRDLRGLRVSITSCDTLKYFKVPTKFSTAVSVESVSQLCTQLFAHTKFKFSTPSTGTSYGRSTSTTRSTTKRQNSSGHFERINVDDAR